MLGRVVVARVPQQRAVIERLFEQRTGLEVRFASMQVGWGWRGVRAVLTQVELAEPRSRRFKALAPEVQLNLETWGIFRGGELSLGRVVLLAPEIEVIARRAVDQRPSAVTPARTEPAGRDENWLGQLVDTVRSMPQGQFDIEAGTLRLVDESDGSSRTMKVSQAVVRRDEDGVSGYGSVLLPELIGRSLFMSIELTGINTRPAAVDGDMRIIARSLSLAEVASARGMQGLVTVDARGTVQAGALAGGSWQANLRRIAFDSSPRDANQAQGAGDWRFDRIDMTGKLRRVAQGLRVDVGNFYVAPSNGAGATATLNIELTDDDGSALIRSDRLPMPVARFLLAVATRRAPTAWPTELDGDRGELQQLDVRWQRLDDATAPFTLRADARGLGARLPALQVSVADISGELTGASGSWSFVPAATQPVTLAYRSSQSAAAEIANEVVTLEGKLSVTNPQASAAALQLEQLVVRAAATTMQIDGDVSLLAGGPILLTVSAAGADAVVTRDVLARLAPDSTLVKALSPLQGGRLAQADLLLHGVRDPDGTFQIDRERSQLTAEVTALDWQVDGLDAPLRGSNATVSLLRGDVVIALQGGRSEGVELERGRWELPAEGAGRVAIRARTQLDSGWLGRRWPVLAATGTAGNAVIDLQAALGIDDSVVSQWRGTVRLNDASVSLAGALPTIAGVRGTVEFVDERPTRSTLLGEWFGGTVQLGFQADAADDSRPPSLTLRGVAAVSEIARTLGVVGSPKLTGEVTWSGSLQPAQEDRPALLLLESSLAGLESRLPAPFTKRSGRALPMALEASLSEAATSWVLRNNREDLLRVESDGQLLQLQIDLPGLSGTAQRDREAGRRWRAEFDALEILQVPALLAAARATIGAAEPWSVSLRAAVATVGERSLGPIEAELTLASDATDLVSARLPTLLNVAELRGRCAGRCSLDWRVTAESAASLLAVLGMERGLSAREFASAGSLDWPADEVPTVRSASGEISVTATDGVLPPRSVATTPVAWLAPATVSVADFAADTIDVSTFATLASTVQVQSGVATLVRWTLENPQGELAAQGRVDLAGREFDLDVDWRPSTSQPNEAESSQERSRVANAWAALRSKLQGEAPPGPAAPVVTAVPRAFRVVGPWDAPLLVRIPAEIEP